ncbi:MAG: hypothetical protein JNM17_39945 [Archangium sp.]|nr:hypothetical protein [Archangium sp.]
MATQLMVFMDKEDELAFVRFLERYTFEVYPRRVPPDWQTFPAKEEHFDKFPEEDVYLVASDIGPALVDKLKRGKDKGSWRVDEVRSPVVFWERCRVNEEGELVSGQIWAETDVTQQTGRKDAAPERFRLRVVEIDTWIKKNFRKTHPKGFFVGPKTTRSIKETRKPELRENKHFGRVITVHGG